MSHSKYLPLWLVLGASLLFHGCTYNTTRPTQTMDHGRIRLIAHVQQQYTLADDSMRARHYGLAIRAYARGLLSLIQYRESCRKSACSAAELKLMNRLFAAGYQELARAEYLIGRYAASLNDFRKALKYDQYNAKTHYYLALIFVHQRQPDLVHQEHDILTRIDPELARRIEKYLQYH